MCTVFAESEIVELLHRGTPPDVILRGMCKSVAQRVLGLAGRRDLKTDIVFTGGVALNSGVYSALKTETQVTHLIIPPSPQTTGALGAAILACREH